MGLGVAAVSRLTLQCVTLSLHAFSLQSGLGWAGGNAIKLRVVWVAGIGLLSIIYLGIGY